jgi:hypothetical protein
MKSIKLVTCGKNLSGINYPDVKAAYILADLGRKWLYNLYFIKFNKLAEDTAVDMGKFFLSYISSYTKEQLSILKKLLDKGIIMQIRNPEEMRFTDVGDWGYNWKGQLVIVSIETGSDIANKGILIHEYVESILCKLNGLTNEMVEHDDLLKDQGKLKYQQVCYWKYHRFATKIEKIFIESSDLTWNKYDNIVNKKWEEIRRDRNGNYGNLTSEI